MKLPRRSRFAGCLALALLPLTGLCAEIELQALFTGAVVLVVDGERHMLRVGERAGGVRLLEADSRRALLEVDGERVELGVSQRIGSNFREPARRELSIPRNAQLQYRTTATINGRTVPVLVDTGANVVALNAGQARSLGIDFRGGLRVPVETAGGRASDWAVSLDSLEVGGMRVDGVQATVLEGDFPATVLLGMSYLQHVDIRESNGVLFLSRDW